MVREVDGEDDVVEHHQLRIARTIAIRDEPPEPEEDADTDRIEVAIRVDEARIVDELLRERAADVRGAARSSLNLDRRGAGDLVGLLLGMDFSIELGDVRGDFLEQRLCDVLSALSERLGDSLQSPSEHSTLACLRVGRLDCAARRPGSLNRLQ